MIERRSPDASRGRSGARPVGCLGFKRAKARPDGVRGGALAWVPLDLERPMRPISVLFVGAVSSTGCLGGDSGGPVRPLNPQDHPTDTAGGSTTDTHATTPSDDTGGTTIPEQVFPSAGRFIDADVAGLAWATADLAGFTNAQGRYSWIPGEDIRFAVGRTTLGTAHGQHSLTPLDLFPGADSASPEVINLARFLQTLDQDGDAENGITLTPEVSAVVDTVMAGLKLEAVDWADDDQVDQLLHTILSSAANLPGHNLRNVDRAEASAHLEQSLMQANQYRRNVSSSPSLLSRKAKVNSMSPWVPAQMADGTLLGGEVHPLLVNWTEEVEGTGALDAFASISLDEGRTWRQTNLSQSAGRSSFTLADGTKVPGSVQKVNVKVVGRIFFATWVSPYCPNPDPSGLGEADPHQVGGPQGSIDYAVAEPDSGRGEEPFPCLWATRGWVEDDGRLQVFEAQQLSSGSRWAIQDFPAGSTEAGFAVAWQEDPEGLRLGEGDGPGDGGMGASVHRQTDIWYSYLRWADALTAEEGETGWQVEADGSPRARAQVGLSSPVRVSDNAACHQGEEEASGPWCATVCVDYDETNHCLTSSGLVLDGDTGASRPNLFVIPKSKTLPDGSTTKTGQVVLAYEESKGGAGGGGGGDTGCFTGDPGDSYLVEGAAESSGSGKTIVYHAFELEKADIIASGDVLSDPAQNGRRARMVVQPGSKAGPADVRVVLMYREGVEGHGGMGDVKARVATGGYSASSFGRSMNMSSPTVLELQEGGWDSGSAHDAHVDRWEWQAGDLRRSEDANPYDDARAHRAQLRGDQILLAFTWTPNQVWARRGEDHYDFYVRRSYDGGGTWTNAAGIYEPPRNLSNLPDHVRTVIEPRLVCAPSTIKLEDGSATGHPEDSQAIDSCVLAYGTQENLASGGALLDVYLARSTDWGESYETVSQIDPATGEVRDGFDWLVQGEEEQGECQIRMSPDGSQVVAAWMQTLESETAPQSDVWLRILGSGSHI